MSAIDDEIIVPEMVGLDALTKIIVAYLKTGGDKEEKSSREIAQISEVSENSVGLNNKFFASIGLLEGKKGAYKLTEEGTEYAKALDWGRLSEAKIVLRKTIKEKPLVVKTMSYVDLNKPVREEDLIARIASFANVRNEARYSTGIRAFIEMLILSGLLIEDKDGNIATEEKEKPVEPTPKISVVPPMPIRKEKPIVLEPPINITINVGSDVDTEKLKAIIKAIREALASES